MRTLTAAPLLALVALAGACSSSRNDAGAGAAGGASTTTSSSTSSSSSSTSASTSASSTGVSSSSGGHAGSTGHGGAGTGGAGHGGAGQGGGDAGALVCTGTTADCDGKPGNGCEVDLAVDPKNCGACGMVCSSANGIPLCSGGACEIVCASGFGDCNHDVTDGCEAVLAKDPANCGACGTPCAPANATPVCSGGACSIGQCDPGFLDCNQNAADGCEAQPAVDLKNCGACGLVCSAGPSEVATCTGGACKFSCATGFADCDGNPMNGCERAVSNDVNNCGACNNVCPPVASGTPTCSAGVCGFNCALHDADCDGNPANGCETALLTDTNNCGACGSVCNPPNATSSACLGGVCSFFCLGVYKNCDGIDANGCETDTATDPNHCGACNKACPAGHACVNSICM